MNETLLPDLLRLFRELEVFAVERRPDSSIVAITHAPSWLTSIIGPFGDMPVHINQAFPFLESFVREAEGFWDAGDKGRLTSGLFTPAGTDLLLRASAFNLGTRCVLVLESLHGEADTRPVLQKAREHQLEHEQLARRMEGVKPFLATIARVVTELRKTELTGAQRELAEAIDSAAAHAQGVAAGTERPGRGR